MTLSYIVDKKQLTTAGVILGVGIIVSAALFGFNAGAQNIFSITSHDKDKYSTPSFAVNR